MKPLIKILAFPIFKLILSGFLAMALQYCANKVFLLTGVKMTIPLFIPGILSFVIFAYFNWVLKKVLAPIALVLTAGIVSSFALYLVANQMGIDAVKSRNVQNGMMITMTLVSVAVFAYFKYKNYFVLKSLEEIDRLGNGDAKKGGFLFEEYIASLYRQLGYDASTTGELKKRNLFKTKGFDQGADVVVEMMEQGVKRRAIIQCKLYKDAVGNKAVQEVIAAMAIYKADYAIVLTNNYFTPAAVELANANNVSLIDRTQLGVLLEKAKNPKLAAMIPSQAAA